MRYKHNWGPTRQSTGIATARVAVCRNPVIGNVRPHVKVAVLSVLHRLRSASNAMQSRLPASLHFGEPFKHPARLSPALSSNAKAGRFLQGQGSFHPSGCEAVEPGGFLRSQSVVGASRRLMSQFVVGASRRSAAPGSQFVGAAGYGRCLSFGCYAAAVQSRVKFRASSSKSACRSARPNPSIERTRPGKPGRASHVKRWAS